jgi:phosphomevalonate kinase
MSKRIILISGYAQSGKDTLANALVERLDEQQPVITKFAHPLRMGLAAALKEVGLGHIDVWTEDPKLKEILRPLMVEFGKWCRARDKDVFVKATFNNVSDLFDQGKEVAIIPDLRYSNEVLRFKEWSKVRVNHLRIGRLGSLAANEEEFQSVKELMDVCPPDREQWFEPGDVLGIQNWATDLCRFPALPMPEWLKGGPVDPKKVAAYSQPNKGTRAWLERDETDKEMTDAILAVRLQLERMDARLKRLEADRRDF